jgi:hypothetical protein
VVSCCETGTESNLLAWIVFEKASSSMFFQQPLTQISSSMLPNSKTEFSRLDCISNNSV